MKIRHSTATVSKTETVHAVCANFAHTASSFSLPDAKILPKCFVMTLLSQSNSTPIAFWVHHTRLVFVEYFNSLFLPFRLED